jgi:hypothetical protein
MEESVLSGTEDGQAPLVEALPSSAEPVDEERRRIVKLFRLFAHMLKETERLLHRDVITHEAAGELLKWQALRAQDELTSFIIEGVPPGAERWVTEINERIDELTKEILRLYREAEEKARDQADKDVLARRREKAHAALGSLGLHKAA